VSKPAEHDDDDGAEVEALDHDLFVETDGLVSSNASLSEVEATSSRRRRRRCSKNTAKRNRYAGSGMAMAYMLAFGHQNTQLESFRSTRDVKWDTYWDRRTTRLEFDSQGKEVRRQCSCTGCDGFFEWATKELFQVTKCLHPRSSWKAIFQLYDSASTQEFTNETYVGMQFSRQDTTTQSFGISFGVSIGPFMASSSYSYVAEQQNKASFSSGSRTTRKIKVEKGQTVVQWQYELVSKCYNKVDMFLEDVTYGMELFIDTTDSRPPTCNPNTPGSCR